MADPFNVTGHGEAMGLPKGSPRDSSEAYEGQSSAPVVADVEGEAWRKDADCRRTGLSCLASVSLIHLLPAEHECAVCVPPFTR